MRYMTYKKGGTVNLIPFTFIQYTIPIVGAYLLGNYLIPKFNTFADDQYFVGAAKLNNGTDPAIELTTAAAFSVWGLMTLAGAYVVPKITGARTHIQNRLWLLFSIPNVLFLQIVSFSLSLVQPALDQMLRFALSEYEHYTTKEVNDACETLAEVALPCVMVTQFFMMLACYRIIASYHNTSKSYVPWAFFGFYRKDNAPEEDEKFIFNQIMIN